MVEGRMNGCVLRGRSHSVWPPTAAKRIEKPSKMTLKKKKTPGFTDELVWRLVFKCLINERRLVWAVTAAPYWSCYSSFCYRYLHFAPSLASLKLLFHQEADSGWCNNKQTSLYIISLIKSFDFIHMSLWVFPVDLGLEVRSSWLQLCLETHSGSVLPARRSTRRLPASLVRLDLNQRSQSLSSAGLIHLRPHSGSIS